MQRDGFGAELVHYKRGLKLYQGSSKVSYPSSLRLHLARDGFGAELVDNKREREDVERPPDYTQPQRALPKKERRKKEREKKIC